MIAGWVVTFPEQVKYFFIADLGGIVIDLKRFGMVSQPLVGWVFKRTSCIAYPGAIYSF